MVFRCFFRFEFQMLFKFGFQMVLRFGFQIIFKCFSDLSFKYFSDLSCKCFSKYEHICKYQSETPWQTPHSNLFATPLWNTFVTPESETPLQTLVIEFKTLGFLVYVPYALYPISGVYHVKHKDSTFSCLPYNRSIINQIIKTTICVALHDLLMSLWGQKWVILHHFSSFSVKTCFDVPSNVPCLRCVITFQCHLQGWQC